MSFSKEQLKKCSKCGILRSIGKFYFRNDNQKYRNDCLQCMSTHHKELYCKIFKGTMYFN